MAERCRCWKPTEPQIDCPLPEHRELARMRVVVTRFDHFTQPSGDAMLAALHEAMEDDDDHPYTEERDLGGEG